MSGIKNLKPADLLAALFAVALDAAAPVNVVPKHLPAPAKGRNVVVGAGKASAAMARALEDNWPGPLSGLVVTRYGHGVACKGIEIVEAAHPVPDKAGQQAAARILDLVADLAPDDLVIALISGGGSALLALPAPGLELKDKQAITSALLKSGATISEMNCVRKHLSAIKGGRLAQAAHPARVAALMISDIPGDDISAIASGPCTPDATTLADARAILDKYEIAAPPAILAHLGEVAHETPKPENRAFENTENILIATAQSALEAAAAHARALGMDAHILSDRTEGEARDVGRDQAALACKIAQGGGPYSPPCVLLSGGETTVSVKDGGRGGRNGEFLLSAAIALDGQPGIFAIACDTDGIDGTGDNAGARIGPDSLARAKALGLDPGQLLENNDTYGFFEALGDLIVTGPTLTNVNDFRAILVEDRTA